MRAAPGLSSAGVKERPSIGLIPSVENKFHEQVPALRNSESCPSLADRLNPVQRQIAICS